MGKETSSLQSNWVHTREYEPAAVGFIAPNGKLFLKTRLRMGCFRSSGSGEGGGRKIESGRAKGTRALLISSRSRNVRSGNGRVFNSRWMERYSSGRSQLAKTIW